jgi:hypothetical protein
MASRKPGGRDSDEAQLRPYLIKPFDNVARDLENRIRRGRELSAQLDHSVLPLPERLNELGAKYWDWCDDNATYLERAFSTNELHQRYTDVRPAEIGGSSAYADLLRDLALNLMRDISFLVSLSDRLRAYVAPGRS